ncbi:MAG: ATP-binding protein [Propionibacteriaceae bacterium]|nr:ATP-binding protein [Propionibacteriaceae bacterium]
MSYVLAVVAGALFMVLVGYPVVATRNRSVTSTHQLRQQAQNDLEVVTAELPSAALLVGAHDEVLQLSAAGETLGLARGSRVGFPALLQRVRTARQTGEPFRGEVLREREPGIEALELGATILPLHGGLVLVLAEDEAAARRAEDARRDFVANVSHELKTPIGAIGILAETIEAAADDPEQVAHFAQRLHQESARLAELVGQIIELSRLQALDPILNREPVTVGEIVDEALNRTRASAEARRIHLIQANIASAEILGDRWQLIDAVANLVQNAINYSDPNARVVVTSSPPGEDGFVEIKVSDNGIGISREDQERIFERFYRVDYGRSRASGGTGLGLPIVRHIATAHGGTVTVWSRLRQGSTFTLRLPAQVPEETP